jgi:thiamine biosynthesis lipoprotein
VEIDGVRYSHIVSPFTGLGLTNRIQATVIAPDATTSDALATACCVLGPERGPAVLKTQPGVTVWVRTDRD